MSIILAAGDRQMRADGVGDDRLFLFFAYVCQSFYPQTMLSYRPNSRSAVFIPIAMTASYARPASIASVSAAEGLSPGSQSASQIRWEGAPEFTEYRVLARIFTS